MSSDTTAPKKSILTSAAEKAREKMNAVTSDEQETPTTKQVAFKRLAIGLGVAAAAVTAVIITVRALSSGEEIEDETTEVEKVEN